jgi:hypothetical protein
MAFQSQTRPLSFVDYAFGLQGGLLLLNCGFLFLFPEAAAAPPSLLEGATPAIFHTLMYVSPSQCKERLLTTPA